MNIANEDYLKKKKKKDAHLGKTEVHISLYSTRSSKAKPWVSSTYHPIN